MKISDFKRVFPRLLIYTLILVLSLQAVLDAGHTVLAGARIDPAPTGERYFEDVYPNLVSTQGLRVDIYTEKGGRGLNVPIGTYTVGDTIKVYIYVSRNCTIEFDLITPDGSVWNRMYGPVNNGTMIDYVNAQYPIGKWAFFVKAKAGTESASDTAAFVVIEKEPYICTKTPSLNLDIATRIDEARFNGKVVGVYLYPAGDVHSWDIFVDKMFFGPDIRNLTVKVQLMGITRMPNFPPGYVDYGITLGDAVEVYGLVQKDGRGTFVILNGFENYYIKKSSTICQSPEIILFTREVSADNLTVRIDGIAMPGSQNTTITSVNWNWGDGQSSDQQFPATHTYAAIGNYVILIKASQSDGLSVTESLSISVPENILTAHTDTTIPTAVTCGLTTVETITRTETLTGTTPETGFSMTRELWAASLVATIVAVTLSSIVIVRSAMRKPPKSDRLNKND